MFPSPQGSLKDFKVCFWAATNSQVIGGVDPNSPTNPCTLGASESCQFAYDVNLYDKSDKLMGTAYTGIVDFN